MIIQINTAKRHSENQVDSEELERIYNEMRQEIINDEKKALAFLKALGMYDAKGRLKPRFKK